MSRCDRPLKLTRRGFVSYAAAVGAALRAPRPLWAGVPGDRLILSAPLTHSDWMLKAGMKWGVEGVKHMLDACKATGWSHVYWRDYDAGRATSGRPLLSFFVPSGYF